MPKLQISIIEGKKAHIEKAARTLFIGQGFHATSMREIAAHANVSLGNLYNYYRTKEELLASIISGYQRIIDSRLREILDEINEPFLPKEMIRFGRRVKALVNEHADYWLLMYIDVLEFENLHFCKMFEGLAPKLRTRYGKYFAELKKDKKLQPGIDPTIAFTALYMQFFNYFLVERLFGGCGHFGLSDEKVITELTHVFHRGVLRERDTTKPGAKLPRRVSAVTRKPQKRKRG